MARKYRASDRATSPVSPPGWRGSGACPGCVAASVVLRPGGGRARFGCEECDPAPRPPAGPAAIGSYTRTVGGRVVARHTLYAAR